MVPCVSKVFIIDKVIYLINLAPDYATHFDSETLDLFSHFLILSLQPAQP